ncbi:MbcA/ParS/Xre antitoxin family protein (plasmid) [Microvirga terrae]|uniref:MbcA/ParS/Xre antitoxin family protein n=1 Tax=Microvirga terrae TaxID=2740529 RepID=A0ABY5S051_9HYPH|nr:antitoxin Xre/MbcA/ParS toxin-binding domain-containing protein [Microvirga terrae]UVF22487.1 MbcA/ParS/Xre antitoxin family protein [Microvirga terrae]
MTQIVDEIRTLIEALYDDPEDFLRGPHGIFGSRPPGELMATEEGQLELLRFLRAAAQGVYMPPNEIDRDFKPYTDADIRFIDEHDGRVEDLPFEEGLLAQRQGKGPNDNEPIDKDYTTMNVDPLLDQAITHLEGQIAQLRSLKGSGPEIATVVARTHEVFGDQGVLWLVEHNQALQATPLDLVSQGRSDQVLTLLDQIKYGVCV